MTPETATPAEAGESERSGILVGIAGDPADLAGAEVTRKVAADLARLYPSRRATVLSLSRVRGASLSAGGLLGPESALSALLAQARELDAPLCALVAPEAHDDRVDWVRLLLAPVLEEGYDFVCPSYLRGKVEGTINTGIAYPLLRALFGKRLRQPLGGEMALSRKLADDLLADEEWQRDPLHAGADVWLVARVLDGGFRTCQSFLGRAPARAPGPAPDLAETLARVLGLIFREMERRAGAWQRIAGSEPVPTFGVGGIREDDGQPLNVSRMVDAFELGYQDLRDIWGVVLPPATLLALKRVAGQPAASWRVGDDLWARVVYDFALGYHMRLMDRAQMLRSMTPLYLGWVASFVNQVRDLDGPGTEERVERLCRAFEGAKPYLISRWRWPDSFNP